MKFLDDSINSMWKLVAVLSANRKTNSDLVNKVNDVIWCTDDPWFCEELYKVRLTKFKQAITRAFDGNFGLKEEVQLKAMLAVLQNTSVLKEKTLIPETFLKAMEKSKEKDYEDWE